MPPLWGHVALRVAPPGSVIVGSITRRRKEWTCEVTPRCLATPTPPLPTVPDNSAAPDASAAPDDSAATDDSATPGNSATPGDSHDSAAPAGLLTHRLLSA